MEIWASSLSLGMQEHLAKTYGENEKHMYEIYSICILYDLKKRQYYI